MRQLNLIRSSKLTYGVLGLAVLLMIGYQGCTSTPNDTSSASYPSGYYLSVEADPAELPSDGSSTSIITATLTSRYGDLIDGEDITFTVTGAEFHSATGGDTTVTVTTDYGYAAVPVVANGTPGTAKVVAHIENVTATAIVSFY